MAVAVHITPNQMSRADYERVIADLKAAGCSEPEGRQFHAAYGDDEVHMFEVWESEEHFNAHRDRLFNSIRAAGVDVGVCQVHPLHS